MSSLPPGHPQIQYSLASYLDFGGWSGPKTWHFMIPYPLLFKLTVSTGIPGPPVRHAWFKAKFLVALPVARRGHSL